MTAVPVRVVPVQIGEFMNKERRFIKHVCKRMKVGECYTISRRIFHQAYPCGWPSIYETTEQAFLSSMVGSAWGAWRVWKNSENGDVTISKHHPSNKRYYVDPDRSHLFKRMPDGSLREKTNENH